MNALLFYIAVNGSLISPQDAPPTFKGSHVLVPARSVLQRMKANLEITGEEIQIRANGRVLTLRPGSRTLLVDGVPRRLPAAPQVREGRLLLPLRAVAQALGARVSWSDQFGPYRFMGITLASTPASESPPPSHSTYSPERLFSGSIVTLNAIVARVLSPSTTLFEAVTEDGVRLYVYAGVNRTVSPVAGQAVRMSGSLGGDSKGTFKAHNLAAVADLSAALRLRPRFLACRHRPRPACA